ncbi:MAG: Subtilase family protein [Candidatus Argoarchaeum ethanivorans]|uniref:Subtilase family protein n=1 Tax=Candidatus Argoarchaeum ethanivorans TaxID=2608793 RepID=A0A811TDB0_9EURY|nr:MAG: Subtilase family protein [Candidatus Argoarchaeum ethanivorans]CAD6494895.1 MAG: Subtilase family protein [Candidatus Argoarchaeum ethanivorans]
MLDYCSIIMRDKNMLKVIVSTLLVCMVVVSCLIASVPAEPPGKTPVIIGFKDKPDPGLIRAHGGEIKYEYHIVPAIAASLPEQAVEALKNNPNIGYIEPDCEVAIAEEVLPSGINRIDAELVWNGTEGGHDVGLDRNAGDGIKIAIIDTGIDYTHPDLDDNVKGGHRFQENGAINDDNFMDDNGHGTHCAGIAAAEDNDIGVIGVAPGAHLYGVKVLNSDGIGWLSDLIAGVEWANDNSMNVISMSLCTISDSSLLHQACDTAYSNGIVVVAASCNDNSSVKFPAKHGSVIAVGATDGNDEKAWFSNFGPEQELMAPGVGIYSTELGGGYKSRFGTSMACPHVSGAAALLFASDIDAAYDFDGDEVWGADEIRKKLQDTADDLGEPGRDDYYGYGLVDAYEAATDLTPPIISNVKAENVNSSGTSIIWTTNEASDGVVCYGTEKMNLNLTATNQTRVKNHIVELSGLPPVTTYYYEVQSTDPTGNTAIDNNNGSYYNFTTLDSMHVASIEMGPQYNGMAWTWATAAVTIQDYTGTPVTGAAVYGHWSGLTSDTDSGTTNENGRIVLESDKVHKIGGTFTFTVDNVIKNGYSYDSWANNETSNSII